MRSFALLLFVAAPTALAAPVPKELKKDDFNRIVGLWAHASTCNGGGNITGPDGTTWRFDADGKATILQPGGNGPPRGEVKFAIDMKADPKTFDWVAPWGEWYGVYELKDDTFTIYISGKGNAKGRNLELKTGPGVEMYSFKRAPESK